MTGIWTQGGWSESANTSSVTNRSLNGFFPLAEVKTKFERLEKPFSSVGLSSKFKAALKGFLGSNFSKAMGCKGSAAITLIKGCEGPQRPNFWSAFKSWSAVGSDHLTKEIQKKGQTNNFSFFLANLFLFVFSSLWRVMTYSVGIYFFTVGGGGGTRKKRGFFENKLPSKVSMAECYVERWKVGLKPKLEFRLRVFQWLRNNDESVCLIQSWKYFYRSKFKEMKWKRERGNWKWWKIISGSKRECWWGRLGQHFS